MMQYTFSEFERQEFAINTIYDVMAEFTAKESKRALTINPANIARYLVLFVSFLAMVNLFAIAYITLVLWS
jgi:hypothetical protein